MASSNHLHSQFDSDSLSNCPSTAHGTWEVSWGIWIPLREIGCLKFKGCTVLSCRCQHFLLKDKVQTKSTFRSWMNERTGRKKEVKRFWMNSLLVIQSSQTSPEKFSILGLLYDTFNSRGPSEIMHSVSRQDTTCHCGWFFIKGTNCPVWLQPAAMRQQ